MRELYTISDVLEEYTRSPDREESLNYWKNDRWTHFSKKNFIDMIRYLTLGLKALGLKKKDRVAIVAQSSPYWLAADISIALAGGITVPLFSNISNENLLFEIGQTTPRFLFIGDEKLWNRISPERNLFEQVIGLEIGDVFPSTLSLLQLIELGELYEKNHPTAFIELRNLVNKDDIATIIYTSGSTSTPKGVVLTHKNLTALIHLKDFSWNNKSDRYLSVLPLAHIFAKQLVLIMFAWGIPTYFTNDLTSISKVAGEVKPTFMIVVPRLLEKIFLKFSSKVEEEPSFFKRMIGKLAVDAAIHPEKIRSILLKPFFQILVYRKFQKALGGHLRLVLSGGASLRKELQQFFLSSGIPVYQGWGLTEASTIAVNRFKRNKTGTVGPPLGTTQFLISSEGEVLVKGPTVMKGYYQNPEATKNTIDSNGWLHTGDQGYIDSDGHLVILGRLTDAFKTAQGEFVNPPAIEMLLQKNPLVEHAMVIGEGKPFAASLIFINAEIAEKKYQGIDIKTVIQSIINEVNSHLNHAEEIHAFRLIHHPATVEGGELTPTLKLRRAAVLEKYKHLVTDIYK